MNGKELSSFIAAELRVDPRDLERFDVPRGQALIPHFSSGQFHAPAAAAASRSQVPVAHGQMPVAHASRGEPDMKRPGAVTGWSDLQTVAAELGIEPLAVKRLIARGRFRGVRLGSEGPWRVEGGELAAYISRGAPDLKGPNIGTGWFEIGYARAVWSDLCQRIMCAAGPYLPAVSPPKGLKDELVLNVNPALRTILTMAPPATHGKELPFATLEQGGFVCLIRQAVNKIIDRRPKAGRADLDLLYGDGPEAYAEICMEAYKAVRAKSLTFTHTVKMHESRKYEGNPKPLRIRIPHEQMMLSPAQGYFDAAF